MLIYVNFFTHHFLSDARWLILAFVAVLWFRTTMVYRVHRGTHRMPLLVAFALVAFAVPIRSPQSGAPQSASRVGRVP